MSTTTKHTTDPDITTMYAAGTGKACHRVLNESESQHEANRRLFKAAPKLLRALQLALPQLPCFSVEEEAIYDAVVDAIAKATGGDAR